MNKGRFFGLPGHRRHNFLAAMPHIDDQRATGTVNVPFAVGVP